jgi:multidrug efflux pump subunit AcrB
MNVAPLSVPRRVVTILLLLGILLLDLFFSAIERRHVDSSPILVSASLPGASPETMEASVAMLLERQFFTIAGLVTMTSMNDVGSTEIVLQFDAWPQYR